MKLADWLTTAAHCLTQKPEETREGSLLVDLAPTDNADPTGVYSTALAEATDSPRVMNIALTGPYGSGKSSIIKSFLKVYRPPALQISLAAFLPEAQPVESTSGTVGQPDTKSTGSKVGRQEIERSILQQMLYGADAKRLPLSRFKRIHSPGHWSILASLFMILGAIACWHLFQKRDAITTGAYFRPLDITNWFNLLAFAIGGCFVWRSIHLLYVASFGISLKSISLKDIEITPKAATEESILNRHLDEIIYFFQSTPYELVVIEDLDRFNNPDIFVTLREINSLVNANLNGKRHIRFLYALRDDMFINTERTKFFEIIIPVIPIINSSNSIDKVLEQVKRLSIDDRLNQQFLREVSRYLNDLRLIRNIFNEYAVYVKILETDDESNLDVNKLLAVLIYKNVFPSDFEDLHRGEGKLAKILRSHDRFIATTEAQYTAEIAHLEELIDQGEGQLPSDLAELRRIYAMAIVAMIPEPYTRVGLNRGSTIPFSNLADYEQFESIIESRQLFIGTNQGHVTNLSIAEWQSKADPQRTFQQRKDVVEKKSAAFKESSLKQIRELRRKLGAVRMMKFNEVLRENQGDLDALCDEFGEAAELARFLMLEGYLDDTYYQYTSLFHSGRLSPRDNKFLILIRSFRTPEPDFQIDNTKEVIVAMRDEDFSRSYVLNVTIVDCLLGDPASYDMQTKRLLEFIASDFGGCEKFLASYYARGTAVTALISGLATTWPGFVTAVLASSSNFMHVAQIISHLSTPDLKSLAGRHADLSVFVSKRLADILAQGIDFPSERLQLLDIEATDLSAVQAYPGVMRMLFDEGLFELSINNLNFIFRKVLGIDDVEKPRVQNYTLVLASGSAPLLAKVDRQFDAYLQNVLFQLPDNRQESVPAIRSVIGRDDLQIDSIIEFLEKQSASLPTLDKAPDQLHAALFQMEKIEPAWANCLTFLGSGTYDAETLTRFLNSQTTLDTLARHEVPDGDPAGQLCEFIIENDALNDEAYEAYVKALPRRFNAFPAQLSPQKTKILVDQNAVKFTAGNLSHLSDNQALGVAFVTKNIASFFNFEDECDLDDDFRQKLLEEEISDEDRLKIIRAMDLTLLPEKTSRAAIVGIIIARTGAKTDNFGVDAARAAILNSRTFATQITLLNMLHDMFDDEQVRDILRSLPDPLPDIRPGFATPRIESSETNLNFVTWLKDRCFISSFRQGGFFGSDIRMYMFRK